MTENHGPLIVEARTALLLDGRVKCRHPERVEDGRNRAVAIHEWRGVEKRVKERKDAK